MYIHMSSIQCVMFNAYFDLLCSEDLHLVKTVIICLQRGIAKPSFVCEGAPKMAPSGRNEPKFCM